MKKMSVADLFSGIGGFSLGLHRTGGFETKIMCEYARPQIEVLRKNFPGIEIHEDIKNMGKLEFTPDVVCGGFPCQPFSSASRGRRVSEDLWPYMRRIVEINKPKFVLAENVQERPIRDAQDDLYSLGYHSVTVKNISAHDCGAPHGRSRWWAIAHPYDEGEFQRALNAEVAQLSELCSGLWSAEAYRKSIRIPDGVSTGLDEPRRIMLGNSVLPQIPQAIGLAIMGIENAK